MSDVALINASLWVRNPYIPIGPLIVARKLRKEGLNVNFYDLQLLKQTNLDSIKNIILNCNSNIICINVFANTLPIILSIINLIKVTNNDTKFILVGPGVSKIYPEIFEISKVDYIVRGEGEITTPKLIKALIEKKSIDNIKGVSFLKDNKVINNINRNNLTNIDVYPDYELINFNDYNNMATIITSRGCPFECYFCSKPIWENGIIYRSLDNVFEEINLIKNHVNKIYFCDDAFIVNKKRVFEFCKRYKLEGMNFKWECTGRIGFMDDEILNEMSSSGCDAIYLGIESGSDKVLQKLDKRISINQVKKEVEIACKYIKKVYTSYIWGFPFETMEDFSETLFSYMQDLNNTNIKPVLNLATPFINSRLYEEHKDNLEFLHDNKYSGCKIPQNFYETNLELKRYIIQNKKIFSAFCYIEHPEFIYKKNLVDKLLKNNI